MFALVAGLVEPVFDTFDLTTLRFTIGSTGKLGLSLSNLSLQYLRAVG